MGNMQRCMLGAMGGMKILISSEETIDDDWLREQSTRKTFKQGHFHFN